MTANGPTPPDGQNDSGTEYQLRRRQYLAAAAGLAALSQTGVADPGLLEEREENLDRLSSVDMTWEIGEEWTGGDVDFRGAFDEGAYLEGHGDEPVPVVEMHIGTARVLATISMDRDRALGMIDQLQEAIAEAEEIVETVEEEDGW